jgi:acyl-CoA thioesterase I
MSFQFFKHTTLFYGLIALFLLACKPDVVRVACVGDSITEGYGLAIASKTGYPVVLDSILGEKYTVLNAGRSATTLQHKGNFPYWVAKEFSNVFAFQPDVIIIKLGTNDTKPYNWVLGEYEQDYQALIDTFNTIATHPKLYLCYPAPVFKTTWEINDSTVVNGIIPAIDRLAKVNHLPIIDFYNGLNDQSSNFPDNIHPNEAAVAKMAEIVAESLLK